MAREALFPNATIRQFKDLFQPKEEYRAAVQEMGLKDLLLDWKPTSEFERRLLEHLKPKALTKLGSGAMRVTSYRLGESADSCSAYVSYGGKAPLLTAQGREGDMGFFMSAAQSRDGLAIRAESKNDHYKVRTWTLRLLMVVLGLILFAIPGVLLIVFFLFIEPRMIDKKLEDNIWPVFSALLGERR